MGRIYLSGVLIGGVGGLALARTSQEGLITHLGFGTLAVLWLTCTITHLTSSSAYPDVNTIPSVSLDREPT